MSTIVFVHAHPDDESSQTAGLMCMASDRGHRVVVVYATGGEHGSRPDHLAPDASLFEHRRGEAEASAAVTGTARVAWLGYHDSGMTGWEQNADPRAFANADPDEAAHRLAAILDEERADVVVGYDWHGLYGHPDHIALHHVVRRAAERTTEPIRLLEETVSRQYRASLREHPQSAEVARGFGIEDGLTDEMWQKMSTGDDGLETGVDESEIAWAVELPPSIVVRKREAMRCHASQTSDIGIMLSLPQPFFSAMFGEEFLIEPGIDGPPRHQWPFTP